MTTHKEPLAAAHKRPRSTAPYQTNLAPREWARRRILRLEEEVAALREAYQEQGRVLQAVLDGLVKGLKDNSCRH